MTRPWPWLALALIGCGGDKSTGDTGTADADADADTDTDADADTDTDADADTDAYTDTAVAPPPPLLTEGYGNDLAGWGAVWWNWLYSMPADANVVLDTTTDCAVNQTEAVFFLGGTFGGVADRQCTIPAGTPLFFPTDTTEYDNGIYGAYSYLGDELAGWAQERVDTRLDRWLEVDGVRWEFDDLEAAQSGPFVFALTVPDIEPNLFDYFGYDHWSGVLDPAGAAGVWILLDPLPPGDHTISFYADLGEGFVIGANYDITVL